MPVQEARGSNAEVDYLAVRKGKIYPVEVKSGKGGGFAPMGWCFIVVLVTQYALEPPVHNTSVKKSHIHLRLEDLCG